MRVGGGGGRTDALRGKRALVRAVQGCGGSQGLRVGVGQPPCGHENLEQPGWYAHGTSLLSAAPPPALEPLCSGVYKNQGHIQIAIQCYEEAIRLNPSFADAYSNMGNALKESGLVDEAVAA
jgi:tetratricopeptide (TPR) repeat protein